MSTELDSFDGSPLGEFVESPAGERNGGSSIKAILAPVLTKSLVLDVASVGYWAWPSQPELVVRGRNNFIRDVDLWNEALSQTASGSVAVRPIYAEGYTSIGEIKYFPIVPDGCFSPIELRLSPVTEDLYSLVMQTVYELAAAVPSPTLIVVGLSNNRGTAQIAELKGRFPNVRIVSMGIGESQYRGVGNEGSWLGELASLITA